jgi:hypothetical protein
VTFEDLDPKDPAAAIQSLHAELLDADEGGASSNDWTQIVDDWFVALNLPTILYRKRR